jgi:putative glutamine amidotransferase
MRKIVILSFLLLISLSLQAKKDTILLFHPTEYNISTIQFLVENDIFQLDKFHFKGVYHIRENYNYSQSLKFLEANPGLPFSLHEVKEELTVRMIYEPNLCSPEFESLFHNSEGAIFMGGPDIPPESYNELTHLLTRVSDPGRHYLELSYLFHIMGGFQNSIAVPLMKDKPEYGILGICLGMQSLNVSTGGSMIQDIPHEVYGFSFTKEIIESNSDQVHTNYYPREPIENKDSYYTSYHFHPIALQPGFPAFSDKQTDTESHPYVLSSHHQAIQKLGKGLTPAALSMDGRIIEAVVHKEYKNVFGVQFHPENNGLYKPDQEFRVTSDSLINFNHFLLDNDSHDFHLNLWKNASALFK